MISNVILHLKDSLPIGIIQIHANRILLSLLRRIAAAELWVQKNLFCPSGYRKNRKMAALSPEQFRYSRKHVGDRTAFGVGPLRQPVRALHWTLENTVAIRQRR